MEVEITYNEIRTEDFIIEHKIGKEKDEIKLKLTVKEHKCPNCQGNKIKIQDYRKIISRYITPSGKKGEFTYQVRRYKCKTCGKAFRENNEFKDNLIEETMKIIYLRQANL